MSINLEEKIKKNMTILGLTREAAIQLIAADAEVDAMTSTAQIQSDLNLEQRQASKSAKAAGRKPGTYNFDTSKRQRKTNNEKQELISTLYEALINHTASEKIEIVNPERELSFTLNDIKYKIVLSAPRS